MTKLYLIVVIIAIIVSIFVSSISAVVTTGNSTMSNHTNSSLPFGYSFDKVGKITMLGSMAMVAGAVILLY